MKSKTNRLIPLVMKDFKTIDSSQSINLFNELEETGRLNLNKISNLLITVGENDIPDVISDCDSLNNRGITVVKIKDGTHGYIFYDPAQTAESIAPFLFDLK